MTPIVSKIFIYPIKSFDPLELKETEVGKSCLLHDREFALFNADGKYVNGKRTPKVNELRSSFEFPDYTVTFQKNGDHSQEKFNLLEDKNRIEDFLSDFFGYKVFLERNENGRFMDVPDDSGITISSEASFIKLREFFPEINLHQMRSRFRANIEITNTEPFWEDRLFSEPGFSIEFRINDVKLIGISPRARCIVPTRDIHSGVTYHGFTKIFSEARKKTLPEWSSLHKYDHYYYLNTDIFIPESEYGKIIKTGDEVKI